ncbi:MAG: hypothetical protein ACW98D_03755 [Promethearchaeota archaeon]
MTESRITITPDYKGVIYVPLVEQKELESKIEFKITPATKDEPDLIENKRTLKRWKRSFGYYCLHPEKFRFGLRDLK